MLQELERVQIMDKLKKIIFSENGMKLVNLMFLLSMLVRNVGFIFVAYIFWIICLVFCIKRTPAQSGKMIYKGFIGFALIMILLNFYFMLRAYFPS